MAQWIPGGIGGVIVLYQMTRNVKQRKNQLLFRNQRSILLLLWIFVDCQNLKCCQK